MLEKLEKRLRPGGEAASRPLHFIWIADCSGSMFGEKIAALNSAIREAIPHMRDVADENPNAQVLVRAIKFSDGANWHLAKETPVEEFEWTDLTSDGQTSMGKAFQLLTDALKVPPMHDMALPPVLVLISDGEPTDDYKSGLADLMALPWGKKAVRVAISIGEDANLEVLQEFIGNPEIKPLQANNPEALVKRIRWVSTAVLKAASLPPSQVTGAASTGNVPIPQLTDDEEPSDATDVW